MHLGTDILMATLLLLLAVDRWLYPVYQRWRARRNGNPGKKVSDTLGLRNGNGFVDIKLLRQAFETHEKMDEKRCDEIRADIKEVQRDLIAHSGRLLVLESRRSTR